MGNISSDIKSGSSSGIVIDTIMSQISSCKLNPGDKLPSERELAAQLNVSRASIREGLKVLSTLGFLDSTQGSGNYISSNYTGTVQSLMRIMFMRGDITIAEFIVFREMLEREAFALCIDKITPAQTDEMTQIVNLMDICKEESMIFELDRRLHTIIIQTAGNPLITTIFESLLNVTTLFIADVFHRTVSKRPHGYERLQSYHHQIVDALISKDLDAGLKALSDHFQQLEG